MIKKKKWKSYQKRIMYKKYGRHLRRYERSSIRIKHAAFMFRVSMDDRRGLWLNDRLKFYSWSSLRTFNLGRKRKGWTLTSPLEWRKRNEGIVYWGEY